MRRTHLEPSHKSAHLQAPTSLKSAIFYLADMGSNGYATVASSIAQDPDNETYVFRRFDGLTARNLLNLQGELLALQDDLDALDEKAASSPDPKLHSSMRSWAALVENAKDSHGRNGEEERKRLKIAGDLEVKLRKYREFAKAKTRPSRRSVGAHNVDVDKALVLSKEVMSLESPDRRMSEVHRCTLRNLALDERTKLEGAEDLVALKPPADQDVVSRTLRNHWLFPSMVSLVHVRYASSLAYRNRHFHPARQARSSSFTSAA
jgi:hypothetical protein